MTDINMFNGNATLATLTPIVKPTEVILMTKFEIQETLNSLPDPVRFTIKRAFSIASSALGDEIHDNKSIDYVDTDTENLKKAFDNINKWIS